MCLYLVQREEIVHFTLFLVTIYSSEIKLKFKFMKFFILMCSKSYSRYCQTEALFIVPPIM